MTALNVDGMQELNEVQLMEINGGNVAIFIAGTAAVLSTASAALSGVRLFY